MVNVFCETCDKRLGSVDKGNGEQPYIEAIGKVAEPHACRPMRVRLVEIAEVPIP